MAGVTSRCTCNARGRRRIDAASTAWEFEGAFEINAFGGFRVNLHEVVSRSAIDVLISHEDGCYVKRGTDYVAPVPPLPAEQLDYLRKTAT